MARGNLRYSCKSRPGSKSSLASMYMNMWLPMMKILIVVTPTSPRASFTSGQTFLCHSLYSSMIAGSFLRSSAAPNAFIVLSDRLSFV